MADYTDEHVGKRVVDQDGVDVGVVDHVRDGDLYVEVGPDARREIIDDLNWDGPVTNDVHPLNDQEISNISEDVVRLNV